MKTIKYIIELSSNNREQDRIKRRIEKLFEEIRFITDGDIEFYTEQTPERKTPGSLLYGLGKKLKTCNLR